jgi:hypothetical protein
MDLQQIARTYSENPALAQQAQEMMNGLLSRSATDGDFRRKLLSEPRTALAEHTGREVPESVNIAFIENHVDATIVLPDPIDAAAELSERELETVAGGSPIAATIILLTWAVVDCIID